MAHTEWNERGTDAPRQQAPPAPAAEVHKARSRSMVGRLVFVLALAVVTLVVLQETVFRLDAVYVVGNSRHSAQQVVAASGLVKGLNIFAVSEEAVSQSMASDHTLIFRGMQKEYPGTVYLYVEERESVAALQWLGIQYTLDEDGLVMDESGQLVIPGGMPCVTGMQVTSVHVGQTLGVKDAKQLTAYRSILSELRLQLFADQISEVNLTDVENIYLVTTDGITVRLGNADVMRAKIGALRTDIAYLRQLGKTSGMLDVITPEDAKFTPES
ncbi:MAG: FtsQ-type POTRA domain-containing protein [Eubacteriales bacterium]|nr:FtsQ-type POTRA domain-containing protein [Eubacteriales bacterium]